ncbi:hypothetical protein BD310DRAFT_629298 [Dichomitus squalens]|uniref:Uncharacterized protein n=1 Tax=Dichomitus squalens TaxID=114155 RepID=A0A4Q9Q8H6_9APHY|nr:hypothetical protein BD310DRAFT_629298 [Dichomitus squalens]
MRLSQPTMTSPARAERRRQFVVVCARNGPCVGKGRGLNGGVVQSGASGRPPSDPHPRSEPLLVASHSERTPSLAIPAILRPSPTIYCVLAAISLRRPALLITPRHSLLQLHSHASRIQRPSHRPLDTLPPPTCYSSCLSVFIKTAARVLLAQLSSSPPWLFMF